ncbi:translation initiation factor IF-2-like [Zerene cesonia]|uniref:translation initiation factor IF-2-like n=1 Tax=Zerene cesonia TaxID=33412 RepID=UPI0018E4DE36|nr:translation initiation factor IF-2-like [Zerene cesonia]
MLLDDIGDFTFATMEKAKAYIKSSLSAGACAGGVAVAVACAGPGNPSPPATNGTNNGTSTPASPAPPGTPAPSPAPPPAPSVPHSPAPAPAPAAAAAPPAPPAPDERVCFVCGGAGFSDYFTIRVKPDPQSTEPYFPFLGGHAPPADYRADGDEDGTVKCCCVCYTFLRQQWEQYDRENKPHSQRFYWMKRLDGKPFIGADMSFQGEYAAQVLGLGAEGAPRDEPAARAPDPPRPASPKRDAKCAAAARTRYAAGGAGGGGGGGAGEEEGGVLDLRARDPSVISVGSQHSAASEPAGYLDAVRSTVSVYSGNSNSSSDRDILDLSMPDKNCMTEVCYVCGDELRRGALVNLHTKEPKDKCRCRLPVAQSRLDRRAERTHAALVTRCSRASVVSCDIVLVL